MRAKPEWIFPETTDEGEVLAKVLEVPPLIGELLWRREIRTEEAAEGFLNPRLQSLQDPFQLTDLRKAAERIVQAVDRQESIVVYGDYDVDGMTSTALLSRVLKGLGGRVEAFLPSRMEEGYGLSRAGVERCLAELKPKLIVAVDCGTTAVEEVRILRERGVAVVVVDHHELPERLPDCEALVNPHRDGVQTYLATVGLVFKLCHGILKLLEQKRKEVDLRHYLDLVAVGTVADLVPLVGDNRILVARGLEQLVKTRNPGLKALCKVAGIKGIPRAEDIGFRIGPRLNAGGRLGDAHRSLTLLTSEGAEEIERLSQELDASNRERQSIEQAILGEAEAMLKKGFEPDRDRVIVIGKRGWHCGVIGIVASRIQKSYYRPTVVIGFDEEGMGKGSGRSIDGCSLVELLRQCSEHLITCGGHEMAAGLSLHEGNFDHFRLAVQALAAKSVQLEMLRPRLKVDGKISMSDVDDEIFESLSKLAPFGQKNPSPLFAFQGVKMTRAPRTFGKNHIKFFLRTAQGEMEAVGFGMAERERPSGEFQIAGALEWDDYRDALSIRMVDWKN